MPGKKIRQIRIVKELSQENLAADIGISQALVSKYENDVVIPNVDMLHKIANALQVFTFELIYNDEKQLTDHIENWLKKKDLKIAHMNK